VQARHVCRPEFLRALEDTPIVGTALHEQLHGGLLVFSHACVEPSDAVQAAHRRQLEDQRLEIPLRLPRARRRRESAPRQAYRVYGRPSVPRAFSREIRGQHPCLTVASRSRRARSSNRFEDLRQSFSAARKLSDGIGIFAGPVDRLLRDARSRQAAGGGCRACPLGAVGEMSFELSAFDVRRVREMDAGIVTARRYGARADGRLRWRSGACRQRQTAELDRHFDDRRAGVVAEYEIGDEQHCLPLGVVKVAK
jgi:hypothetical protein